MKNATLPFFPSTVGVTIQQALDRLENSDVSALAFRKSDRVLIVQKIRLQEALASDLTRLEQVEFDGRSRGIYRVPGSAESAGNGRTKRASVHDVATEESQEDADRDFRLTSIEGGEIHLQVLEEMYENAIRTTSRYQCDGKPPHYFPRGSIEVGEQCPLSALCSPTGGPPSTIVES